MSEYYLYGSEDEKVLYKVLPLINGCQTYTDGWHIFRALFDNAYAKHGHPTAAQTRRSLMILRLIPSEYVHGNLCPRQTAADLNITIENVLKVVRGEIDVNSSSMAFGVSFTIFPSDGFKSNPEECLLSLADYMYSAGVRRAGRKVFSIEDLKERRSKEFDLPPTLSVVYMSATEVKIDTICVLPRDAEEKLKKFLPDFKSWSVK